MKLSQALAISAISNSTIFLGYDPTTGLPIQIPASLIPVFNPVAAPQYPDFSIQVSTLPAESQATGQIGGTAANPIIEIGVPVAPTGASGNTGSGLGWQIPASTTQMEVGNKYLLLTNQTLTFPATAVLGNEIIVNNLTSGIAKVGTGYLSPGKIADFVYEGSSWVDINGNWNNPSGSLLQLQSGYSFYVNAVAGLGDLSPNGIGIAGSCNIVTGINNLPSFQFASNQLTLGSNPSGASGSTLYIVYSAQNSNYNLVRTLGGLDDYWYFSGDGNGYIGTFLNSRDSTYPASMPSSGNHLITIHANNNSSNNYQVFLDGVSKGVVTATYNQGNEFVIATTDKPYSGQIQFMAVYPSYLSPTGSIHQTNYSAIKSLYTTLSLA